MTVLLLVVLCVGSWLPVADALFGLKVFKLPSMPPMPPMPPMPGQRVRIVRDYFSAWNRRDMLAAIDLFSEDCEYEDTLYPKAFRGRAELKAHLLSVATSLPTSFKFVIDDVSEDSAKGKIGVQWHVESSEGQLPFTRGASMYTVSGGKITKGFDVPEPVVKSGAVSLALLRQATPYIENRARLVPAAAFVLYCYFLFLSDLTPGKNALALDPATWEEVKALSLNFWLVLPSLSDAAPVLHPVLEGVFNLLLAYSALFTGFLASERRLQRGSTDGLAFGPTLVGMQFLTNALYLPYLVTRKVPPPPKIDPRLGLLDGYGLEVEGGDGAGSGARGGVDVVAPPTALERLVESPLPPVLLTSVALASVCWAVLARPEFGGLSERLDSFALLASSDRLTFSFLVDLACFAVFQGWLVDGDAALRTVSLGAAKRDSVGALVRVGKTVPFFGLVAYFLFRPRLPMELE